MEENNKNNMDKLTKLILGIDKAMEMTREKRLQINNMKEELKQETRPMMVKERQTEIKDKEKDKKEFDKMTERAMIRAKKEIQSMREQSEKEYQEKLMETIEKQKEIQRKLYSMENKGLTEEKLAMARNSASKALNKANEEMKLYQDKHFEERARLNEFELDINNYARELGVDIDQEKVVKTKTTKSKKAETKSLEGETKNKDSEKHFEEKEVNVGNPEETLTEAHEEKEVNAKKSEYKEEEKTEKTVVGVSPKNNSVKEPEVNENLTIGEELPKVAFVEVKDNKYIVAYETKKDGVYSIDKKECEKLGFFKGFFEKAKLVVNRKEYGIDFMSAMRADVNIFRNLNDKDKEKYLSFIAGQIAGCFDINYDNPKSRQANALAKGYERLALKEAKALEQYGPEIEAENSIIHDLQQSKYDKLFGEGFDQHDNPPIASDKNINEEVGKTVRDILYGNVEKE